MSFEFFKWAIPGNFIFVFWLFDMVDRMYLRRVRYADDWIWTGNVLDRFLNASLEFSFFQM